jgi:hypothetical protein
MSVSRASGWLILAGPTRTGTTTLFRHLAASPAFCASFHKETDYFLHGLRHSRAAEVAEYRRLFAAGNGVCLEGSPLYFAYGAAIAQPVAALPGEVKVLLTFREPVERFRSLLTHVQTKRNLVSPPSAAVFVEDALRAMDFPADPGDENSIAFREGCYRELLGEWISALGSERVRVVFFESLAAQPETTLAALHAWLGVRDLPVALSQENASRDVRGRRLHALAMRLNHALEPLLNRVQPLRAWLRRLYYSLNGRAPADPLPAASVHRLRAAYAQRNAGLRAQVAPLTLGPLPDWVH